MKIKRNFTPDSAASVPPQLNIAEDLGQVAHVFTDKTGTLTQNHMVFRAASVRGVRVRADR